MKTDRIGNRRLYAFLRSQTLTILMLLESVCLFLMPYLNDLVIPGIIGGVIFCVIIGYSFWFWIKKPKGIVINNWLANISSVVFFYWFIINAMNNPNQWWFLFPILCIIAVLIMVMVKQKGFEFKI